MPMTAAKANEIKPNMQLFRLSIVMTFIRGNRVQLFNPFGESRLSSVPCQIWQYRLVDKYMRQPPQMGSGIPHLS
jgi:hypothetical protein